MKKIAKSILYTSLVLIVILLLLYPVSYGAYTVRDTTATDPGLPSLTLNSYKFHSETFGNPASEPLLILHGGPGADYRYLYSLKPLSQHYYLIYFDQRGTGLSPRVPSSELTLDQYLRDVDAFVEFYGRGRPVYILGHSWGAMLAAAYAGQFPQKVKGLILAEPGPLKKGQTQSSTAGPPLKVLIRAGWAYLQSMHMDRRKDPDAPMDYVFGAMMEGMDSAVFHVKTPLKRWRGGYAVFNQLAVAAARHPDAVKALYLSENKYDFKKKVLFLCGENSPMSGASFQQRNMKLFLKPEPVIIRGAGHCMLDDNPKDSIREIESYLNGI